MKNFTSKSKSIPPLFILLMLLCIGSLAHSNQSSNKFYHVSFTAIDNIALQLAIDKRES